MQGFGGRATREGQRAKYVNSPEGELYRKSRTLYGIERARSAIAKAGRAVVVEGYTDVIAAHQAGVAETVAVMGTAITPEQVKLLSAYAEEVVLALDADRAGREAMQRAARRCREAGATARRLDARGEDPADMLAGEAPGSSGAERFVALVDAAVDLPAFHVRTLDEADLSSPAGRDRALDEVVPVLASMADSITREELARGGEPARCGSGTGVAAAGGGGAGGGRARQGERVEPETVRQEPRILSAQERQEQGCLRCASRRWPTDASISEDQRGSLELDCHAAGARLADRSSEAPGDGLPREDSELCGCRDGAGRASAARTREPGGDGDQLPVA